MHRGASWASGAAQAAQFVRIILRFAVSYWALRGGFTRLEKPDFSTHQKTRPRDATLYVRLRRNEKNEPYYTAPINPRSSLCAADSFR